MTFWFVVAAVVCALFYVLILGTSWAVAAVILLLCAATEAVQSKKR